MVCTLLCYDTNISNNMNSVKKVNNKQLISDINHIDSLNKTSVSIRNNYQAIFQLISRPTKSSSSELTAWHSKKVRVKMA